MPGARQHQGVDHPAHANERPAAQPSSWLRKPKSKLALCATSGESSMNSSSSSARSAKRGLSDRKIVGQPVDRFGLARHRPLGIEISVEVAAGLDPVEDLDAADLDHAVAAGRVEPGGLGIEDDFAHGLPLSTRARVPRQARMCAHLGFGCRIGRRRCRRRSRRARACPRRASGGRGSRRALPSVMPGRASTRSRWTSAGADTTMTLSNAPSPPVSNSKGMSNSRAGASAWSSDEARRAPRAPRDGRSPPARRARPGLAEHSRGQRVAVEPPVADRPGKRCPMAAISSTSPSPCSRRTSASASNTGTPARSNILATVDLPMPIEPVSASLIMRRSAPRSRSAPSSGSNGMPRMVKWSPSIAIEQLHARPLHPEHADAIADLRPFGVEIGLDEARPRGHEHGASRCRHGTSRPLRRGPARPRWSGSSACPRRSADDRRPPARSRGLVEQPAVDADDANRCRSPSRRAAQR